MNEIETYIKQFPDKVQGILRNIRKLIKDNAPNADELFAYGMPAYKTNKKPLVYFAAFKSHIGLYATPSGHSEFQDELSKYKQGRGSVQFPLDKPIPYKLIERIVKFKVTENNRKATNKTTKTQEQFELAISCFSEDIKHIARETRKLIHKILPNVVEVVWVQQKNIGFGTGVKKKTEHFCWLMPASKHVNLGFNYGSELPDQEKLLEGTGKLFRHIKIKSVEQLNDKNLIDLLTYATTYKVPQLKFKK